MVGLMIDDPDLGRTYRRLVADDLGEPELASELIALAREAYTTDPDHVARFGPITDESLLSEFVRMWGYVTLPDALAQHLPATREATADA